MKRILSLMMAVNFLSVPVFASDTIIRNYSNTVIENGSVKYEENYSYNSDNDGSKNVEIIIGEDIIKTGNIIKGCGVASYIQTDSGSAMLPLRAVSAAVAGIEQGVNVNVSWDSNSKSAHINYKNNDIVFKSNSSEMFINNKKYEIDNGAFAEIKDKQLFVPLRALCKALDVKVEWDAQSKTVTLFK